MQTSPDEVWKRARAAALGAATESLWAASDPDDVVKILRIAARQMSGVDGVAFALREGEECHYVAEDAVAPLWRDTRYPLANCLSGISMIERRTIIVPDVLVDPRVPLEAYASTFVRSVVMVPVRANDPLAAVGYYWAIRGMPDEATVGFLEALTSAASNALDTYIRYRV